MKKLMRLLIFVLVYVKYFFTIHRFPYKKRYSGRIAILANGPSLKDVLRRIETDDEFKNTEFCVMNFFANDPLFTRIKPKFYCLADPMFKHKNRKYKDVKAFFERLNAVVDWDIELYIPRNFNTKEFLEFSGLTNSHINVFNVNDIAINNSYEGLTNLLMKYNYAGVTICTVAQLCIYTAINNGFDEIRLYGVDHNMICSIAVDEENRLCAKETHFYDDEKTETTYKPLIQNSDDQQYRISNYIIDTGRLFKNHDVLDSYAKSVNVRIINCTKGSLIDSYERSR